MAVDSVGGLSSSLFNEALESQTSATSNNSAMSFDDYLQLFVAQIQYQDMTNPMSNSEMMSQMTQLSMMTTMSDMANAVSNFATVTNNLSQVLLTSYSTGLIGKEVTVAVTDSAGNVTGEKKGLVTGVDLTGAQYVYVDGERYSLTQVMSVGEVPEEEEEQS